MQQYMSGFCSLCGTYMYVCKQKPDTWHCVNFSRDRLGFNAEMRIIFGRVYSSCSGGYCMLVWYLYSCLAPVTLHIIHSQLLLCHTWSQQLGLYEYGRFPVTWKKLNKSYRMTVFTTHALTKTFSLQTRVYIVVDYICGHNVGIWE